MKTFDSFTRKNFWLVLGMSLISLINFTQTIYFNGGMSTNFFVLIFCLIAVGGYLTRDYRETLIPLTIAGLVGASYPNDLLYSFGLVFTLSFLIFNSYKLRPRVNLETVFAQFVLMIGLAFPKDIPFSKETVEIYLFFGGSSLLVVSLFAFMLKGKSKRKHIGKGFAIIVGLLAMVYNFFVSAVFLTEHYSKFARNSFDLLLSLESVVDILFISFYSMMAINSVLIFIILAIYIRFFAGIDHTGIGKEIESSAKSYFGEIKGVGSNSFKVVLFGSTSFLLLLLNSTLFNLSSTRLIILFSMICFLLNLYSDKFNKIWRKIR